MIRLKQFYKNYQIRRLNATFNIAAKPVLRTTSARTYLEWSNNTHILDSWTSNAELKDWIIQQISHMQPSRVHLCDGSIQEYQEIIRLLTAQGTLIKLNEKRLPNSYLARSDKNDVARTEETTFICSESKTDSGPTNNWMDPLEATHKFEALTENCMRGRTMFVLPFCMGPFGSKLSKVGIQITDSPLVVAQMRIMTRMGISVMKRVNTDCEFIPCLHTVGQPLGRLDMDDVWPSNKQRLVVHFPEQQRIMSFGSGYGGNALLGKKCLALRIASTIAHKNGWLAEHMLIVGVTSPAGEKKYIAAAFPSACGKTNMAMMQSALPGWKVECLGDDIAWMQFGADGRLYAINPEFGFFGVAPGTSMETNPNMIEALKKDTIYTNVGITSDFDVWWEGKTKTMPPNIVTWLRKERKADDAAMEVAHPNSRFCTPLRNCPILDPNWDNPNGVPIDAIVFGGRRSEAVPLVSESRGWSHGVFMGSVLSSETTAAAAGRRGLLRIDPFAMKPFCGYNMADYFSHWLKMEEKGSDGGANMPKMFRVNWFRKQSNRFVWPGFGENIRVIKWIFERCDNAENYIDSPIGRLPKKGSIDVSNLKVSESEMDYLMSVNKNEWKTEVARYREFYKSFDKGKMPEQLTKHLDDLEKAMKSDDKK